MSRDIVEQGTIYRGQLGRMANFVSPFEKWGRRRCRFQPSWPYLWCFNLLYQRSKVFRMSRDFIGEHQKRIEIRLQKDYGSSVLYSPNSPQLHLFPKCTNHSHFWIITCHFTAHQFAACSIAIEKNDAFFSIFESWSFFFTYHVNFFSAQAPCTK